MLLHFTCLTCLFFSAHASEVLQQACDDIDGYWSQSTNSCFKYYQSESANITNDEAWSFCMETAPPGTRGRLAQIPSKSVFLPFQANYHAWIAAYAPTKPTQKKFKAGEWVWIDKFANGTEVTTPMTWYTSKVVVWQRARCMIIDWNGRFNDEYCDNLEVPFCEYVEAEVEAPKQPEYCNSDDIAWFDRKRDGQYLTFWYDRTQPGIETLEACLDGCIDDTDCLMALFSPEKTCVYSSYEAVKSCSFSEKEEYINCNGAEQCYSRTKMCKKGCAEEEKVQMIDSVTHFTICLDIDWFDFCYSQTSICDYLSTTCYNV